MVLRRSAHPGGMVLRKTGLRGPHQLRTNSTLKIEDRGQTVAAPMPRPL
jgi:hypothetical protein